MYIRLGMKWSTVAGNFLLEKPAMATVLRGTAGQFPGRYPNSGLLEYDTRVAKHTIATFATDLGNYADANKYKQGKNRVRSASRKKKHKKDRKR